MIKIFYILVFYLIATNEFAFCGKKLLNKDSFPTCKKSEGRHILEALRSQREEFNRVSARIEEINSKYDEIVDTVKSSYEFVIKRYMLKYRKKSKSWGDPFANEESINEARKLDEKLNDAFQYLSNEFRTEVNNINLLSVIQDMTERLNKIDSNYISIIQNFDNDEFFSQIHIREFIEQGQNLNDSSVYQPMVIQYHKLGLSLITHDQSFMFKCTLEISQAFADVLQRLTINLHSTFQLLANERIRETDKVLQESSGISGF